MATIQNLVVLKDRLRHVVGFNCAVFIAAAATPENLAVPTGARWALIKPAVADVWVKGDGAASVPAADDATGVCRTTEETILKVGGVSNLSFITGGTNVCFYKGEDL